MHKLFVRAVFENPAIPHGTAIPNDFEQIVASRVFPNPRSAFSARSTVYTTPDQRLVGFYVVHQSTAQPKQVELNMFCSDAALGVKDLGNHMLQRVIEQHGRESAILVRTWLVNKRAMAFYMKNGFEEAEREDPAETAKEGRPAKITLIKPGPPHIAGRSCKDGKRLL